MPSSLLVKLAWMDHPVVVPRSPSGEYGPYPPELVALLREATDAQRADFAAALGYADRMQLKRIRQEYGEYHQRRSRDAHNAQQASATARAAHSDAALDWFNWLRAAGYSSHRILPKLAKQFHTDPAKLRVRLKRARARQRKENGRVCSANGPVFRSAT